MQRQGPAVTASPPDEAEKKLLGEQFVGDVKAIAKDYLATNRAFAEGEMQRLGISQDPKAAPVRPTEEVSGEVARMQVAAEGLAKLQLALEVAREIPVGFELRRADVVSRYWHRSRFDPDVRQPRPEIPPDPRFEDHVFDEATEQYILVLPRIYEDDTDAWIALVERIRESTKVQPYAEVQERYAIAEAGAQAFLRQFPDLYVLWVAGRTETSRFAGTADPAALSRSWERGSGG